MQSLALESVKGSSSECILAHNKVTSDCLQK